MVAASICTCNKHQVGDLVDHHDDERQRRQIEDLLFMDRLARFSVEPGLDTPRQHLALGPRLGDALVVAGCANAELRHVAIAVLHAAQPIGAVTALPAR